MSASLVGSEMCIRDRRTPAPRPTGAHVGGPTVHCKKRQGAANAGRRHTVSYTHLTLPTICSV
eukprot:15256452-Alexandrium_andersonii.AAC.1